MATFTNQATLTYAGGARVVTSNTTSGQMQDPLVLQKTANATTYNPGDTITYVVTITNNSATTSGSLRVNDDMGSYLYSGNTVYSLSYVPGSIIYLSNGALQTAPTVSTTGGPLNIYALTVPGNGNITLIYQATLTTYAPLAQGSGITNTATAYNSNNVALASGSTTVQAASSPYLTITKSLSPTLVSSGGTITYTFQIMNYGNSPANTDTGIIIRDTFTPAFDTIAVTYNGTTWTEGTDYTYTNGTLTTTEGNISVSAATYTVDTTTGAITVNPGISTVIVTGTAP